MIHIGYILIALILAALLAVYALDLRAKLEEAQQLLADAQQRCERIQDQLDNAEELRENTEAELRDCKNTYSSYALDLRVRLDDAEQQLAEAQQRCASLQDKLDDAEQHRENAEAELRDYKNDISFVMSWGGEDAW